MRHPHAWINFLTPLQVENLQGELKNRWKKKSKKGVGEPTASREEVREMPICRG
jgi:hypothetical protein